MGEIAQIYEGNSNGIVVRARPRKKRSSFPQMLAFDNVRESNLRVIAEYMLKASAGLAEEIRPRFEHDG